MSLVEIMYFTYSFLRMTVNSKNVHKGYLLLLDMRGRSLPELVLSLSYTVVRRILVNSL